MPEALAIGERDSAIEQLPQNQIHRILQGTPENYENELKSLLDSPDTTKEQVKTILLPIMSGYSEHQQYDLKALIQACENLNILTKIEVEAAQAANESLAASRGVRSAAEIAISKRGKKEQAAGNDNSQQS